MTSSESTNGHCFSECSTFADDIKGEGYSFQADWHFLDLPYLIDGGSFDSYDVQMASEDVHDALSVLTWFLMDVGDYKQSSYYKQIISYFPDEDDARSFALRLIIHYVGDIHQPFHAVTGFSSEYSTGDRGGNDEDLPDQDNCGTYNLHGVWDSVMYQYCGRPSLPLSTDDWNWYSNQAALIRDIYNWDDAKIKKGQFYQWAAEAFDIVASTGYDGVTADQALSNDYIAENETKLIRQLSLAGYRLAYLLEQIYPNGSSNALF